jgi:hypothetical protein
VSDIEPTVASEQIALLEQIVAELQALRRLVGTIFLVTVLWMVLFGAVAVLAGA